MPVTYVALIFSVMGGRLCRENGSVHIFYSIVIPLGVVLSVWSYVFGCFVTFCVRHLGGVVRFIIVLYLQVMLTVLFGSWK